MRGGFERRKGTKIGIACAYLMSLFICAHLCSNYNTNCLHASSFILIALHSQYNICFLIACLQVSLLLTIHKDVYTRQDIEDDSTVWLCACLASASSQRRYGAAPCL